MRSNSTFKSAEQTPFTFSWSVGEETSPDVDLASGGALQTLRRRSHQLIKDNPVVAGLQQAYLNLISASGPAIYSASDNKIQRNQINELLPELLKGCDITGTKSIYKIIEEIVSCSFADGDVLISLPMDSKRSGLKTVVELIEAYRVDTPTDKSEKDNIRHGVQYDSDGRIEGFWVKNADDILPYNSKSDKYKFYPMWREANGFKRKVTVLFKAPSNSRPLASRQYPLITPAMPFIKNLDDFLEATVIGARVAACFSAFVMTKNPNAAMKSMTTTSNGTDINTPDGQKRLSKLQPGTIMYLNLNEEVNFASPNKPSDNTDSFLLRGHKIISMCLRIPYIIAFLDTSEVSYSSWRGAVLDSYKMARRWRRDLDEVLEWVINTWILEAISNELVRGSAKDAKIRLRWPAPGILDQEKEARGNKLSLESETTSRQKIADETGADFEEIEKDLEEEALRKVDRDAKVLIKQKEYEEKNGIKFPTSGKEEESKVDDDPEGRRKDAGNW